MIYDMKTIIRWLADVSGVSQDVRYETMKDIGGRIYQDHYWFNGGVNDIKGKTFCVCLKVARDKKINEYKHGKAY